ncbi:MAG: carbamate kinase [Ilumatobacteraceae bacterium]|nr:carbamate kinase [Ilumatobacteraceae bacterium]
MLVVIALGGNALLRRGEPLHVDAQRSNIATAVQAIAGIARDHDVVLTHGNGPQVGLLALQNDAYPAVAAYPLDVLDAESEGMVGYLLEQELGNHLPRDTLATLLTQVVVDPLDPAFVLPTKFIGPVYEEAQARELADQRGWAVAADGPHWRRVVPSPAPRSIVEIATIRLLVSHGVTTICAGGGGIPVVPDGSGGLRGIEAVIDKDLASSLIATELGADALLLLTDVDAVHEGWGSSAERPIGATTAAELRSLDLPAGSMGPKVEAICRFAEGGGAVSAIGALAEATEVLAGAAGTSIRSPQPAGPVAAPWRDAAEPQADRRQSVPVPVPSVGMDPA